MGDEWGIESTRAELAPHPNGATRIVRATLSAPVVPPPVVPPIAVADVRFVSGAPRLELDLGGVEIAYLT